MGGAATRGLAPRRFIWTSRGATAQGGVAHALLENPETGQEIKLILSIQRHSLPSLLRNPNVESADVTTVVREDETELLHAFEEAAGVAADAFNSHGGAFNLSTLGEIETESGVVFEASGTGAHVYPKRARNSVALDRAEMDLLKRLSRACKGVRSHLNSLVPLPPDAALPGREKVQEVLRAEWPEVGRTREELEAFLTKVRDDVVDESKRRGEELRKAALGKNEA